MLISLYFFAWSNVLYLENYLNDLNLQAKSNEVEKMKVGLNETKKGLEASKAETQSLLSKEQQLLKKVQSCNEEIVELKGQLQVKRVIENEWCWNDR